MEYDVAVLDGRDIEMVLLDGKPCPLLATIKYDGLPLFRKTYLCDTYPKTVTIVFKPLHENGLPPDTE